MSMREIIGGTLLFHWILIGLFLCSFLVQMGVYLLVFLKFVLYKKTKTDTRLPEISVLICAKNEEQNLERFLPLVLEQDYPEFEVIVVNHGSTDDTELRLVELKSRFKHLRYTSLPPNDKSRQGKKLALTIGLKAAAYEHIILTDADCYPESNQWLRLIASNFSEEHTIVLGYGGYQRGKGLLNTMIRYETTFTAIQYFSYAIKGKPYMGVGRNLAYRKTLFFENKGFSGHLHLLSGDDDLFVNQNATAKNCTVEFSPGSRTYSLPKTRFSSWIVQKKRHLTAGNLYKGGSRIRLAGEWGSRIILYTTLVWICVASNWQVAVLGIFGILLITRLTIFKMGMHRLDEKYLLLPSLLLDPVFPVLMGAIWLSSRFEKKHQTWR